MSKIQTTLLTLFLLLIMLNMTFAVHCREITSATYTGQKSFQGCYASTSFDYNNLTYTKFATPDGNIRANGFGIYVFHCTNGNNESTLNYAKLLIDGTAYYNTAQGKALMGDIPYCTISGGTLVDSSEPYGYGDQSEIKLPLVSLLGGHTASLMISYKPIGGTYESDWRLAEPNTNFFVGLPSMSIFSETDLTTGFYENEGYYDKNILFTLLNKSVFENKISSYQIRCSGNISCSIKQGYNENSIDALNGKMIIPGTIRINKDDLPLIGNVWLDVNYYAVDLNHAGCATYLNNSTQSKPLSLKVGLMDKQDFQIEVISDTDQANCVGENGMIGQTGEAFAPMINIGFGGVADANNSLIAIDECDPRTPQGQTNTDAVYCSQGEFIVELSRKISEAIAAKNAASASKYLSFDIYLRSQELTNTRITQTLSDLNNNVFGDLTAGTGLESSYYEFEQSKTEQVQRMKTLFNAIKFSNTNLTAGLYHVTIDINSLYDLDEDAYLFTSGASKEINPALNPTNIIIQPVSSPYFPWPFYNLGYDDVIADNINVVNSDGAFYTTNYDKRGVVLELVPSGNDFSEANLYKTYAVPLSVKITGRDTNTTDANFFVAPRTGETHTIDSFTYWTGYASTLGSGCKTIANNTIDTTLPYRTPDVLKEKTSATNFKFALAGFENSVPNHSIYLDTILFLPKLTSMEGMQLIVPFTAFTKNQTYLGTSASPKTIDINSQLADTNFVISGGDDEELNLTSVFNGVRNGNICINKSREAGQTKFTLFWNQAAILKTLNSRKAIVVTDANICSIREY